MLGEQAIIASLLFAIDGLLSLWPMIQPSEADLVRLIQAGLEQDDVAILEWFEAFASDTDQADALERGYRSFFVREWLRGL